MTTIRRVVTGELDGKAVYAQVEEIDPVPGTSIYGVWGWDHPPTLPLCPSGEYRHASVFPPATGVRVNVFTFPPAAAGATNPAPGANEAWDELVTGVPVHRERGADTRFVATDTIDIVFVLDGEVVLELDDGQEQTLRRGDVLVQNGTRHSWANRTDRPCTLGAAVFTVGRT